jgi:hypothetical protein
MGPSFRMELKIHGWSCNKSHTYPLEEVVMRPIVACCLMLVGSLIGARADAQWRSDSLTNSPVCIAKFSQTHPDITSDGAGGAFIVWQDIRSTYNWDIYAQRISANGERLWGASGIPICTTNFDQYSPIVRADGYGGAFIVWTGGTDIYAQHIKSDGTVSYETNGIPIGQATREQRNPVMEVIKPGRAIVAFEDLRNTNSGARPDISLNILTPLGAVYPATGYEAVIGTGGQRRPRLIADGMGGALMAWETDYGLPIGVQASLLDSNGTLRWNNGGAAPGITIFRGLSSVQDASNISLGLSGQKFLLAWQVKNMSSNNGQDIFCNRISRTGDKDWFSALEVTGEWPSDQTDPTIIADDSNGFIVFFEDYAGDIPPRVLNRDVAAVRFRSNGIDRIPAFQDGFFYITRQSRAQRFYRMVQADDRIYFAWDDARASTDDTAIYAQAIDMRFNRYYPSFGTSSSWGKAIAVRPDAQQEHVAMCKREGGGVIMAWADNRNGDQDIYAQVMFPDGTLPIELTSFDVSAIGEQVIVEWRTAMEQDHAGFEIERRALNGQSQFQVIASYKTSQVLQGSGNTDYEKLYGYNDKPSPGIYEYRIADVALDGTRRTYTAKQINTSHISQSSWGVLPAYPNPSSDKIMLSVSLAEPAIVQIDVSNALGQIVLTKTITQDYAGTCNVELPIADLTNGTYVYRVRVLRNGATLWTAPLQRFQIVR